MGNLEGEKQTVFEDGMFSYDRLKLSFVSSLTYWAGLISSVDLFIVRILLCIL